MKGKKAATPLDMLISGAIIILIAVITVSIAISINDTVTTSVKGDTTLQVINESIGAITVGTPQALTRFDLVSGSEQVWIDNGTVGGNFSLTSDNYTMGLEGGTINFSDSSHDGNLSWINYSYFEWNAAFNASSTGTTGLAAFGDYWTSIISILILVIIVGLFAYFRSGGIGGIEIQ